MPLRRRPRKSARKRIEVTVVKCQQCAAFSIGEKLTRHTCPAYADHPVAVRRFSNEPDAYAWIKGKVVA